MDDFFQEAVHLVEDGKKIFGSCIEGLENPVVIIFNDADAELLRSAKKYYNLFVTNYNNVIIFTTGHVVEKLDFCKGHNEIIKILAEDEMRCVLHYQKFFGSPALKCITLTATENIKLKNIIGIKSITMDNLVYHEFYGMYGSE